MKEVFITKPPGVITRSRHLTLFAHRATESSSIPDCQPATGLFSIPRSSSIPGSASDSLPGNRRTKSDSAYLSHSRRTSHRVIVTKRKINTPFELRKNKITRRHKTKIQRQKPLDCNARPLVSSRRPSAHHTPLNLSKISNSPPPSPIPKTPAAPHLPSSPVDTPLSYLSSIDNHQGLSPKSPTSPFDINSFELPPQELVWDNYSPTPSFQEFATILEDALEQLYSEENQIRDEVFNDSQSTPLDDNLPGSALNASTSTHNISVDSLSALPTVQESIMADEATKLMIERDECLMIDEDCEGIVNNPDRFSIEKLDQTLSLLEEKAISIRHIIAFFRNSPDPRFPATCIQSALALRIQMRTKIEFIHEHRTLRLKTQPTIPPSISSETSDIAEIGTKQSDASAATTTAATAQNLHPPTTRINTTTYAVKQARVRQKRDPLLVDMDDLCEKLNDLKLTEVKQLGQFNKLNGQFKELLEKAQRTLHKAKSLCEDAMCTDMEQDATAIDTQSTMLEIEVSSVETFVDKLRARFGVPVTGHSFSHRSSNIPIPNFSGSKTDKFDLFTFKKKFQIFIDSMPSIAEVEALEMLKEKCLQGNAQLLCSAEKSIEACMKQLSFHYGSKTNIIAKRKALIMELGQCPKFNWEQQITWMVKLRSLLADTQEFAKENDAEHALYHGKSDIANSVLNLLKGDYFKEMSKKFLLSADATGEEDGQYCYEQLLIFLDTELRQLQYQLNQHEGSSTVNTTSANSNTNISGNNSSTQRNSSRSKQASSTYSAVEEINTAQYSKDRSYDRPAKTPIPFLTYTGPASEPALVDCALCQSKHKYLFQCQTYVNTPHKEKRKLHGKTKACHRCLRMDANVNFDNIDEWWNHHKNNCRTSFYCKTDSCMYASSHRVQKHILACSIHVGQNKEYLDDFRASLPQDIQVTNGNLLFMDNITMNLQTADNHAEENDPNTFPDVTAPGIFMCQNVPDPSGNPLFIFYDSGCGTAAISASASIRLNASEHRPGPTFMNVAGGKVVRLPYGSDKFQLPLDDSAMSATIIAAKMDTLTAPFPRWELNEPYDDLVNHYKGHELLPTLPDVIGGGQVDIILGIKYNYLFPTRICSLPCGLSLYRSPLKGINGHTGVLGGPHKAWAKAAETANFVGAAIFFTNELSAYRYTTESLLNSGKNWCAAESKADTAPHLFPVTIEDTTDGDSSLDVHTYSSNIQHVKTFERKYFESEDIGTQAPYRCIACRGCHDCKNGDILEATSLREEAEQLIVKNSVKFKPDEKRIVAKLPFIADPVKELQPNRSRALKVLETQLRKLQKDPEAKSQVIASHDKLAANGYSCDIDELSPEEKALVDTLPGEYYLPWRFVTKENSISTPVRVVFDASATTSSGKSLNDVLAKGTNKLEKILALDINFRAGPFAFACDIRMAYNQIKLEPSDFRWHKYLWVDNLNPSNPVRTRIMRTIIYGVKPSGNQTAEGIEQVAQYVIDNFPEHAAGAQVLRTTTYVDDSSDATDTEDDREKIITGVKFTLDLAGMSVKSFVRSSAIPEDTVSSDGIHVGYLGYRWAPLADTLSLDVKPLSFGKTKRGKRPPPVEGNLQEALIPNFTKRTILSQVASNYDLVGICTPVTAKFKADYHDLLADAGGWDDGLPSKFLPTWVANIETMQELASVSWPRSVIPLNSQPKVDLLVSVDASQNMAIVCVHVRSTSLTGKVTVRLAAAKSKIVTGSTIPRAELRAAVAGTILARTVARNLKGKVDKVTFFTDSSVVLSWLHQDARPLSLCVRSCVIEIHRFSSPDQWRHVESENNIADLGTRFHATIKDIDSNSTWQNGKSWMYLDYESMPVQSFQDLKLTMEAKQAAAQEVRILHSDSKTPQERTAEITTFSNYLYDPCKRSWPKSLRIIALVRKFCFFDFKSYRSQKKANTIQSNHQVVQLSDEEIQMAESYYFRLATKEVLKFSNSKTYGNNVIMDNGILKYNGRIVEGTNIEDVDNIMTDLSPLHFVKPVVDRHSMIAYSIMLHAHQDLALHRNVNATLLESRHIAYILNARDLSKEVRAACPNCRKFKAKLLEAEMGPIHQNRLTIAPPFYYCQLDLMGPFLAHCEHNHRSSVKIWGLVCRDPASSATACYAMTKYNTDAFLQAFQRFVHRYCYPKKVYIDPGAQLIKGVSKSEFSLADITKTLNGKRCTIEYEIGPTAAHNYQGCVERSIKEIKTLFNATFHGLKLDVMSYETAFSYIANEINNMPICTVSRTDDIGHADLITPNRLIHGRNNRRAPTGPVRVEQPSRLLEQMERLYQSWWQIWLYERLPDYIPKPKKFGKTGPQPKEMDIVVFLRAPDELVGDQLWRLGQVTHLITSDDGVVRQVIIRWRKHWKEEFHETRRSVRHIAILFSEDELTLVDHIRSASSQCNIAYIMTQKKQN